MKALLIFTMLTYMIAPFQQNDKRQVLLFASDSKNSLLLQQQKIFSTAAKGIKDRDIEVQVLLPGNAQKASFTRYKTGDAPFTFILIGKDGGEKLRSHEVVSSERLFGLIDQMPMRKREMGH